MASGSAGGFGGVATSEPIKIFETGKRKQLPTNEDRKRTKEEGKKRKQGQQQKASSNSKKSSKKAKNSVSASFSYPLLAIGGLKMFTSQTAFFFDDYTSSPPSIWVINGSRSLDH